MPVVFAWLIGDAIGSMAGGVTRLLMSRVFLLMAVWLAVPGFAYFWGAEHIGKTGAIVLELAAFGGFLVCALYRPFSSAWRMALVDGLLIWCRVMTVLSAVKTVLHLFGVVYEISFILALAWAIKGAMAFGISKAIYWWLGRQAGGMTVG